MRTSLTLLTAFSLVMAAAPAMAGNLTFSNGNAQWQSTRCTEPTLPPSLLAVSSETPATDMNIMMEQFNAYAANMQAYMDCLSNEAQNDSDQASRAIIQSAQASISAAQAKVNGMRDAVAAKQN